MDLHPALPPKGRTTNCVFHYSVCFQIFLCKSKQGAKESNTIAPSFLGQVSRKNYEKNSLLIALRPFVPHRRRPARRSPMALTVEWNDRQAARRQRGQRDRGVGERQRRRLSEDDRRRRNLAGGDRARRRGPRLQGRRGV